MRVSKANLEQHIAIVERAAERADLISLWKALYDQPLPKNISLKLMKLAVAYRLQEKVQAGLNPAVGRYLSQIARARDGGKAAAQPPSNIPAGTRLVRQWRGRVFEAVVEADHVVVNEERYASLSDAARSITGAHWSGPRFFGLRKVASK